MILRTGQAEVTKYTGGYMAISAVPGSGKTTTLSLLAAKLIDELLPRRRDTQVLVVTFSNSAVATFRSKIAGRLQEMKLPRQAGYDVRTLHSLAHMIVQSEPTMAGLDPEFHILDEGESVGIRGDAVRIWIERNPGLWRSFVSSNGRLDGAAEHQWRQTSGKLAVSVMRAAKSARTRPGQLLERLSGMGDATDVALARMGAEIYQIYQGQLEVRGAVDFDDLVWLAYELLRDRPALLDGFRARWPFLLEDEAQDSSPLQERLLELLAGPDGNWVRVGDANQAINATFTSADPRFFRAFCRRPGVRHLSLEQSGRSSERIIALANGLVEWVCESYPEPELRQRTFEYQRIVAVSVNDSQPNPPAEESGIELRREYRDSRQELNDVAHRAVAYTRRCPQHTLAVLCPTNRLGTELTKILRGLGAEFDELLRTSASARTVAQTLARALYFVSEPTQHGALSRLFQELNDSGLLASVDGAKPDHIARLLSSAHAEALLYPEPGKNRQDALPPRPETTPEDCQMIERFAAQAARWLRASTLPIEEYLLTVATELFRGPFDLALAQQIAVLMRRMSDDRPAWRLTDLAVELNEIAFGGRGLVGLERNELGFEPRAGRITVSTMHKAKGLEWDLVYLVGTDRQWFPSVPDDCLTRSIEALDGDPEIEVTALVRSLLVEDALVAPGHSPTHQAHLDLIAERLRLLYVGITRAKRNLSISWSADQSAENSKHPRQIAPVLEALRRFEQRQNVTLLADNASAGAPQ